MARQMTELLDEYIPVIEGSEVNDDPMAPPANMDVILLRNTGMKRQCVDTPQRNMAKSLHTRM